jgi:hypothetical protein
MAGVLVLETLFNAFKELEAQLKLIIMRVIQVPNILLGFWQVLALQVDLLYALILFLQGLRAQRAFLLLL